MINYKLQSVINVFVLVLTFAVAGYAGTRACLWDSTNGLREAPVHSNPYSANAYSYAEGLNNLGDVIGWGSPGSWKWSSATGRVTYLPFQFAWDINDNGEIIGDSYEGTGWVGYFLDTTGLIRINKLPGDAWASPSALNNSGQVVGYSGNGAKGRPFIWDKVNGTRLLVLPDGYSDGSANGINKFGVVAGKVHKGDYIDVAVLWTSPTSVRILNVTSDVVNCEAYDINDNGQVAGRVTMSNGSWCACIWEPDGTLKKLGTLPGRSGSYATAINNSGQVIGYADGIGFIWDSVSGMRELGGSIGRVFFPCDINDREQVCCWGGMQKYKVCTIAEAKKEPYDTCVQISDVVVTGKKPGAGLFVESINRCSGILVEEWMESLPIGTKMTIRGIMGANMIESYEILSAVDGKPMDPLGVTSSALKPCILDPEMPHGLDMTGILIRIVGKVIAVDRDLRVVYVDDGGALRLYDAPASGIKVYIPEGVDIPQEHSVVAITGVGMQEVACIGEQMKIGQHVYPAGTLVDATSIVCRESADITTFSLSSGLQ